MAIRPGVGGGDYPEEDEDFEEDSEADSDEESVNDRGSILPWRKFVLLLAPLRDG